MLDPSTLPHGVGIGVGVGCTTLDEVDSPRACARVVALALMSDGRIKAEERDALHRCRAFARLGLDEQAFWCEVLQLCGELLALPAPTAAGTGGADHGLVERILDGVRDPERRLEVLQVIQACMLSDGRVHPAEWSLLRQTQQAWRA